MMRLLTLPLFAALVGQCAATPTLTLGIIPMMDRADLSSMDRFFYFKASFNKTYVNETEHGLRFANFEASLKRIDVGNTERASRGYDQTLGITKFSDLTPEEFRATYLTLKPRSDMAIEATPAHEPSSCAACALFPELRNATGDTFDWTTKGAVTPVKDQGQCGSCWAFGTTGDIEGVTFLKTGKLVSLSEQELVSCDTKEDQGCQGGLQENAFAYIQKTGLTTEKDYPYTSGEGTTGKCKKKKIEKPLTFIKGFTQISKGKNGEAAIKTALPKSGPITIGINAGPMQDYNSGIDSPRECKGTKKSDLDHAVLIVGYGVQGGKKYWKIKNSWASSWGEDGYYRIVMGKNECGLAFDAVHSHD